MSICYACRLTSQVKSKIVLSLLPRTYMHESFASQRFLHFLGMNLKSCTITVLKLNFCNSHNVWKNRVNTKVLSYQTLFYISFSIFAFNSWHTKHICSHYYGTSLRMESACIALLLQPGLKLNTGRKIRTLYTVCKPVYVQSAITRFSLLQILNLKLVAN